YRRADGHYDGESAREEPLAFPRPAKDQKDDVSVEQKYRWQCGRHETPAHVDVELLGEREVQKYRRACEEGDQNDGAPRGGLRPKIESEPQDCDSENVGGDVP